MKKQSLLIIMGCLLVALGIKVLTSSELVIGGTAGMGMILQHLTPFSFGTLFFFINIPFYFLSIIQLGLPFTIKSFISVTILSIMSEALDHVFTFTIPFPIISSLTGGVLIGFGLILLFRCGSSLGGVNMLCVYLDKHYGVNPGKTILATDVIIVGSAFFIVGLEKVLYSIVAILVMSRILGRYHKTAPLEKNNKKLLENENSSYETFSSETKSS
ncbi:YitT family protein [Bacillus songklensis]|uniref:YitT family protein n=1 Tax=Bacillus songklensis TaxID=1069116 RepID=A0ABV8AX93_9BACI